MKRFLGSLLGLLALAAVGALVVPDLRAIAQQSSLVTLLQGSRPVSSTNPLPVATTGSGGGAHLGNVGIDNAIALTIASALSALGVNAQQVNGVTIDVSNGAATTGTIRIVTSTDSKVGLNGGANHIGNVGLDSSIALTISSNISGLTVTPVSASMFPTDIQRVGGQPVVGVANGNIPVSITPGSTQPAACSGQITSGSSQTLLSASGVRQGFHIQALPTNAATIAMTFENTAPAVNGAGSYQLLPGSMYTTPPGFHAGNIVTIIGTQNDKFTCDSW